MRSDSLINEGETQRGSINSPTSWEGKIRLDAMGGEDKVHLVEHTSISSRFATIHIVLQPISSLISQQDK